jgi:CobW/HypB/UreG, nucleotide-binding domain
MPEDRGPGGNGRTSLARRLPVSDAAREECEEMGIGYYDALLPVREPGAGLPAALAGIRFPYRMLASIGVPAGQIVLALVSDDARLSQMFAANWARAGAGQQPDATLYALARPACGYGLDDTWDQARWWSREHKMMAVFGFGSYRLAKVCVRGICSAVTGEDMVFVHGCAMSVGAGPGRRGVVIMGSSGAGKTTLVAGLLRHREYSVAVLNDDWGAVSLRRGDSVSTGEPMLHMKAGSVLALRPGFFTSAATGSYLPDLSEPGPSARMLVAPHSVYGSAWSTTATVVDHVAVVVREPAGWRPPGRDGATVRALESGADAALIHHHEAFFNGSLILQTEQDKLREERRYRQLLDRITVSWINNCSTPDALVDNFIGALMTTR